MSVVYTTSTHDVRGLSTDTKPTARHYIGSFFDELDTGKKYYFTGTAWVEYGEAETPTETPTLNTTRKTTVK